MIPDIPRARKADAGAQMRFLAVLEVCYISRLQRIPLVWILIGTLGQAAVLEAASRVSRLDGREVLVAGGCKIPHLVVLEKRVHDLYLNGEIALSFRVNYVSARGRSRVPE